jgi:hypothetical protein
MPDSEIVEYLEKVCRDSGIQIRREFLGDDSPGNFAKLRGRPTVFVNSLADAADVIDVLFRALTEVKPYEQIRLRDDVQRRFDDWWRDLHR